MKYSKKKMNSLKKGKVVPLLNFKRDAGVPLLNFEAGPGVPLLNFRWFLGPGSWGPGPTFTPCVKFRHVSIKVMKNLILQ